MNIIHVSDLHLGKSIHGVSMVENGDQTVWVDRFLATVKDISPQAVVIAGDVYDRSAPAEDAVALFSRLLTGINDMGIPVMTVAGNHDSVHRLAYAGPVLSKQGLYFSRSLSQTAELEHVTLNDGYGAVTFWLMPYVFPALISRALGDDSLKDYDSAVRALISAQPINEAERNVLIAHQNVTFNGKEAERGGSESMIGGVGQIDVSAFDAFDYVALGHIHASYSVGRDSVRYAGSPLCYHFDETRQKSKGPVLVDIGPKGEPVRTETLIIEPLHPMREIRGSYEEIRDAELSDKRTGEYISIILDDRRVTTEIAAFFRELYKDRDSVLMEIKSAYNRFAGELPQMDSGSAKERSTEELFADFYSERNGGEPPEEKDYLLMDHAGELMRHASDLRTGPGQEVIDKFVDYLLRQEVE